MKLLISAEGSTLSSRVSKRFGHAPQYLIVDTASLDIRPISKTEKISKQDIIVQAVQEGVVGVITGHVGPHAFTALAAHGLFAVLAHHVTIAEAIERFNRNELRILSGPVTQGASEDLGMLVGPTRERARRYSAMHVNTAGFAADTARGRHHLQQLAGRGH